MSCSSYESGSETLQCEAELDAYLILLIPSLWGREYQRRKRENYVSKYSSMQNLHLPDIQTLLFINIITSES